MSEVIMLLIVIPKITCPSCKEDNKLFEIPFNSIKGTIKVKYEDIVFKYEREDQTLNSHCNQCGVCIYFKMIIVNKKIDNLIYWTTNSKLSYLKKRK